MVWCRSVYPAKQVGHQKFFQKASRNLQTPCASRYILCDYWTVPCRVGMGEEKRPKRYHQGLSNITVVLFVFNNNILFSLVFLLLFVTTSTVEPFYTCTNGAELSVHLDYKSELRFPWNKQE